MAIICLIRPGVAVSPRTVTENTPVLPLGLAYVAASLREAGHEVTVIDCVGDAMDQKTPYKGIVIQGLTNDQVVERIPPDTNLIGVGVMFSHDWPNVREMTKQISHAFPDTPIMAGGEHISSLPELALRDSPIRVCGIGEGEAVAVEIAEALTTGGDLTGIPGIAYEDENGEIVRTGRRDRIRNVNDIPWPAWDLFRIEAYTRQGFGVGLSVRGQAPVIPLLATRGCPYECTFCTSPDMWTTAWITRDPKKVVDEIEHYVNTYGARNFPLADLTAIVRKDWIMAFCQEILDRGLDITWQLPTGTRSEAVDAEVAAMLRRAGMYQMAYAPESGSDRVRQLIKKRLKAKAFYSSARAAIREGLKVQAFFVVGFPEETRLDTIKTLGMMMRLAAIGVHDVGFQHYMPYPGSEIYNRLVEEGKVTESDEWLLAPAGTIDIRVHSRCRTNENFSALWQSVVKFSGYAVFYTTSVVCRPWNFARLIIGMIGDPLHDITRLQIKLKRMIGISSADYHDGRQGDPSDA